MNREHIGIGHQHAVAVEAFGRDFHATTLTFDLPTIGPSPSVLQLDAPTMPMPEFRLVFRKAQDQVCSITAQLEARWGIGGDDAWDPVAAPYATAHVLVHDANDAAYGRSALMLLGAMQVVAELFSRELCDLDAKERRYRQGKATAISPMSAWVGGDC
jgi:hypothetical protein